MNNMNSEYFVMDEDGLYRMFDVSHDGLEDAIEFAQKVGSDVLRDRDGETETVWSFEDSEPREDNFRDDAEADADALAMAGFGSFSGFSAGTGSAGGLAGSVFSGAGTVLLEATFSGSPPFSGSDDGGAQPAGGRRASRKMAWIRTGSFIMNLSAARKRRTR